MKKLISLLIVCVLIGCISDIRYHIDKTTNPTDTLCYLKSDMSLLNGMVYNEFGDVGMFKNGKRVGLHKEWYESDQLKSENYHSDYNEENPYQREWYQSGQLKSELYPKRYKEWYESGQLKIDGKYNDVIKDETCVREWYENGRLKSEKFYKKNILNGLHREWYENGSSKYECNYERGCKIGLEKEWYKSSRFSVSDIHGVRTDGFISQLKREKNYSDCLFYIQKVWYENGQLKSEKTYDNGELIEEKHY